jgi:hypothetical protein
LFEGVRVQDNQLQMNQREGKSTASNENKCVGSARLGTIDVVGSAVHALLGGRVVAFVEVAWDERPGVTPSQ